MTVVIAAVPYIDTNEPIMAPALLKAVLTKENINAVAIDLNIEVIHQIDKLETKQQLLNFFFSQQLEPSAHNDIVKIIDYCSNRILQEKPTLIALSLFCYSCQIFTRWLCARLRQLAPTIPIVIGGTGIKNFVADNDDRFYTQIRSLGLVDDFIFGDGETSFVEYVKGNRAYPGINNEAWATVDLSTVPFPDYVDYDFSLYGNQVIPVNDSRGCIKDCEFCDIIEHWKKFQFRSADHVFAEMLYQIQKHNRYDFALRNSLTNGNMKEFHKLLDLISEYNQSHTNQISWAGYFIIREPNYHPEDLWVKIKQSNGRLFLGVESVVFNVRHAMGKTFTDDALEYHLAMSKKYSVDIALLMIVAYPTETLEDYEKTKQWFIEHREYADHVKFVNLSFASILPNTQLSRRSDEYGIKRGKFPSIWINQNLNITSEQRIQYLLELEKLCNSLGFVTMTSEQTIEHTT